MYRDCSTRQGWAVNPANCCVVRLCCVQGTAQLAVAFGAAVLVGPRQDFSRTPNTARLARRPRAVFCARLRGQARWTDRFLAH
jgi:hypothetical protein